MSDLPHQMQNLKQAIKRLPGVERVLQAVKRHKRRKAIRVFKTPAELFAHYYRNNNWGSQESVSGEGSTLKYTEKLRAELPRVLELCKVKIMLDAPCGDFNWMRLVPRENGIRYIGGDIVEELIERNRRLYADATTEFKIIDVRNDPLPTADIWMCRDCLFHLSDQDIFRTLGNFSKSDIHYLLTSTHPHTRLNLDIDTGDFRLLDLEKPPFNFPKADIYIDDWIEGFPVRQLGLWSRDAINKCLKNSKAYLRAN
jgi:hypothetical protein